MGSSYEDIQKKVIETAQKKGADGVILYNMEQRIIGSSYSSTTDHRQWLKSSTNSYSSNRTEGVLHADFININLNINATLHYFYSQIHCFINKQ